MKAQNQLAKFQLLSTVFNQKNRLLSHTTFPHKPWLLPQFFGHLSEGQNSKAFQQSEKLCLGQLFDEGCPFNVLYCDYMYVFFCEAYLAGCYGQVLSVQGTYR